jgi:hypothetical protein
MNVSRSFPVFAIVFAVVYAVMYVIAVEKNYALFTYHPALEEFGHVLVRLDGDVWHRSAGRSSPRLFHSRAREAAAVVRLVVDDSFGGDVCVRLSSAGLFSPLKSR